MLERRIIRMPDGSDVKYKRGCTFNVEDDELAQEWIDDNVAKLEESVQTSAVEPEPAPETLDDSIPLTDEVEETF